jgi:hypothetical protein
MQLRVVSESSENYSATGNGIRASAMTAAFDQEIERFIDVCKKRRNNSHSCVSLFHNAAVCSPLEGGGPDLASFSRIVEMWWFLSRRPV